MENKSVLHFGNIGDVFSSLAAVKEYSRITGKKIIYYLFKNRKAVYPFGVVKHPTVDEHGNLTMLNAEMIRMMIPLLKAQDYIADAKEWEGEHIDVDLNKIREVFINMGAGILSRWYFIPFPNLSCDISKQYINIPDADVDIAKGKIIVNRTERYNNELINYFFLKKYEKDVIFSGTTAEYDKFCKEWKLDIPYLQVDNFLELAQAIKQAKFLLANQSMLFQIAEGAKTPRILEICNACPNVIPIGGKGFDFSLQNAGEYHVETLYNEQ